MYAAGKGDAGGGGGCVSDIDPYSPDRGRRAFLNRPSNTGERFLRVALILSYIFHLIRKTRVTNCTRRASRMSNLLRGDAREDGRRARGPIIAGAQRVN